MFLTIENLLHGPIMMTLESIIDFRSCMHIFVEIKLSTTAPCCNSTKQNPIQRKRTGAQAVPVNIPC